MDFSLSNEQRAWQMTARKFAQEEIKPISLALDEAPDAHGTFDWDIIEKGSKLGFRTLAVPKDYGGEGTDFVTQALVMAELARGDSAISKTFSQNWKWSHLISQACNDEQKERFLRPFVADHRFLLGKGITEPGAGSDNRLPPEDAPKAGLKLRAERHGFEVCAGEDSPGRGAGPGGRKSGRLSAPCVFGGARRRKALRRRAASRPRGHQERRRGPSRAGGNPPPGGACRVE